MFGLGVVKGLGITLKHFIETYVDDVKYFYFPNSATSQEAFARRQGPEGRGIFTVEYPEMKLQTPENFRFMPFLITDYDVPKDSPDFDRAIWLEQDRCTSCGICAKVCPPQCIWIVRTDDPKTGKPIPQPEQFYIDTDVCMNCGYCAEFCPFDAIKMDHDYELADYEREVGHIHDLDRLLKPISYYAAIRPTWNAKEEAARRFAEEEKERKAAEKAAARTAAAAPVAATATAEIAPVVEAASSADAPPPTAKRSPEEIKAMREAMMAKKQQGALSDADAPAVNAEAAAAAEIKSAVVESAPEAETTPKQSQASPADADATAVAPTETFAPAAATSTGPDDLKLIEGIGPKIATLLQSVGISTFAQLAATDVSRLEQILVEANLRRLADPTTWPEQAKLAAVGDWDALKALTDQLKGGRRA